MVITKSNSAASLLLILGLPLAACSAGTRAADETAAAPADTSADASAGTDTLVAADTITTDTLAAPQTQPPVATPPISPPPEAAQDTPPAGGAAPSGQGEGGGGQAKITPTEYEGWRQYSVNCARCHGQDVLPNPVAANLLVSVRPGGPVDNEDRFFQIVNEGRLDRGMPAFKEIMSPEQIRATYAYVRGRAENRIPPGRPAAPSS